MIYRLYRGFATLAKPLVRAFLWLRMLRGKEDRQRLPERSGIAGKPRPDGRLVWLHGASVGEAISLLPLIEKLLAVPGVKVLLTTGTVTSAALMDQRLPEGAVHQYMPVDRPSWAARFLDHWHPDLALWAESEFWPNILNETKARGIPVILVNGRISDRSFRRWQNHLHLIGRILGCFALCLGQTPEDAERLRLLGASDVRCLGNLKFAAPPLPADEATFAALEGALHGRKRWLAASTHPGEEEIAAEVHLALKSAHAGLLSIIVPRHPVRGAEIAAMLEAKGLAVSIRSRGDAIDAGTDVLLADTMGEVGLFYRLAPIVFMGKSLVGQGGQNPLEPARLSASVLFGPHMDNFAEIARQMLAAGAAEQIEDAQALAAAVGRRLADPALVVGNGDLARRFALAQSHILDAVFGEVEPFLGGGRR